MNKFIIHFIGIQMFLLSGSLFAEDPVELMPPRDQGLWQTVSMLLIAVVFFYFILWRPEQKRRKALETQRSGMKKGDRVTAMGIIGIVVRVQEHTVILKMYDGSKIEVLKAAITDVQPGSDEDAKKMEKEDRNTSKRVEISEVE